MGDTYTRYLESLRARKPLHQDALPLDTMVRVQAVPPYEGIVYAYDIRSNCWKEQRYLIQPVGEDRVLVHEPHHLLRPVEAIQPRLF